MTTSEPLFNCPYCGRSNFTERGLRAHVCQGRGGKLLSLPAIHMIKRGHVPPTSIDEKAGALVYGNVDDLKNSLRHDQDIAVLQRARELAGQLREGKVKCHMLDVALRKLSAAQASATPPISDTPIMSKPVKHALALVADPGFVVKGNELSRLQQAAIEQMKLVAQLQTEAAVRAILVGTALHRIKASMKHGTFMPWCAKHITVAKSQVNNYMRLASVFLERSKVAKPDLLALPGDQLSLETESATAKRFMEKLAAFCGDNTLTELLIKHGIKAVGLKTALEQGEDAPAAGTAEDYFAEVAERIYGFRQIITSRESLQRLTPQQLETLNQTITDSYSEFRRLYEEAKGRSTAVSV